MLSILIFYYPSVPSFSLLFMFIFHIMASLSVSIFHRSFWILLKFYIFHLIIHLQENTPPTDYPKHYVENRFVLALNAVTVALEDVLEMRFSELSTKLEQRPSANAIQYNIIMNNTQNGKPMLDILRQ